MTCYIHEYADVITCSHCIHNVEVSYQNYVTERKEFDMLSTLKEATDALKTIADIMKITCEKITHPPLTDITDVTESIRTRD